jgi:hypothetical protein
MSAIEITSCGAFYGVGAFDLFGDLATFSFFEPRGVSLLAISAKDRFKLPGSSNLKGLVC